MLLDAIKNFALGYGTIGTGVISIGFGIFGYSHGDLGLDKAAQYVLEGFGLIFLRRAIITNK